jgi:prevent-host-death family protein
MPISLTEDFKTVAELKQQPEAILRQVHETGRPVVITVEGKPDVVILDAATYERQLKAGNLVRLLSEGEADIRAGRVRPAEEVFRELLRGEEEVSD